MSAPDEILERLLAEPGGSRLTLAEWEALLPDSHRETFREDDGGDDLAPSEDGSLSEVRQLRFEDTSAALRVSDDDLRRMADHIRKDYHPDGVVTYIIDRNINYSNVCTSICNFCAFYVSPGQSGGYVLSYDTIYKKIEETLALGGSGVLMQGGLHPDLKLDWYTELLRQLKARYPIHLHCFSPTEIHGIAEVTGLSYREILDELMQAGLDSMPGGGGEILVDEVRRKRRSKVNTEEWLGVMEAAHDLGLPTTATMMFGHGERLIHRLQHLERIRELQDRTGGFISFIPWNFQPDNTPLGKVVPNRVQSTEYLRWLALARIYLSNIPNVQVSWLTQGLEVGKQGLHWGANDLGSTMIEENVIKPAGANHEATADMLSNAARAEGFIPLLRNAAYRRIEERPEITAS